MRIENDSNGVHWAAGPWWPLKVLCMLLLMAAFLWRAVAGDSVVLGPLGLAVAGGAVNLWHYRLLRGAVGLRTTGGLLRWIRHPMYLGDAMKLAGFAWASWWWPAWLLCGLGWMAIGMQSLREDRLLAAEHPEEHAAWRRSSARLLPGLF